MPVPSGSASAGTRRRVPARAVRRAPRPVAGHPGYSAGQARRISELLGMPVPSGSASAGTRPAGSERLGERRNPVAGYPGYSAGQARPASVRSGGHGPGAAIRSIRKSCKNTVFSDKNSQNAKIPAIVQEFPLRFDQIGENRKKFLHFCRIYGQSRRFEPQILHFCRICVILRQGGPPEGLLLYGLTNELTGDRTGRSGQQIGIKRSQTINPYSHKKAAFRRKRLSNERSRSVCLFLRPTSKHRQAFPAAYKAKLHRMHQVLSA
ncbi:hypothetical protein IJ21_09680 [Paenibacillus sp. 32O-W]|nr:hypothetical protein IJ21_09680 [Paenibacillus sp. 32O-W]